MNNIYFIGLGNMGSHMALNLIKKKYSLSIFDINSKLYSAFENKNVKIASKPIDLAPENNVFISMLPDGNALMKLLLGGQGLASKIKKNSIFIDCSSSDYASTLKASNILSKRGVKFLDAPVSGGVTGAKSASLTIMVGGEIKVFKKAKKILSCMGKNIIYVGKTGSGQIVKACNNMMLGINMIGICEAFLLSKKLGISPEKFFDICSKSTGSSWAMMNHLPIKGIVKSSAANNRFKPGYAAKLILKDLKISQNMAKAANVNTEVGKKAFFLYKKFCKNNRGNLDYSAIIKKLS